MHLITDQSYKVFKSHRKYPYWIIAILLCSFSIKFYGQEGIPSYPDSLFSTYYLQRVSHFKTLPQSRRDIVFLGNSITDGAEWAELFGNPAIKNRGISGDITAGVLHRLRDIIAGHPAKIFLLIGINDLARNIPPDTVVHNIRLIADILHKATPATKLYVQSLLPVNDAFSKFP
ncbi:MAG TPA: GDSL-type esterase/lipase family protein, partial [Sediminibacterium sp.]|nr:GDSL-type esterase/lipase family protein [Sediminibacterium sp.]